MWAMHFVGMEAFHLRIGIEYDWPTALLSLVVAVAGSWVSQFLISRRSADTRDAIWAAIALGAAITAMYFVAMSAMRLPAVAVYSLPLVALAVAVPVAISFYALQLALKIRDETSPWELPRIAIATLKGLAICSMHYLGMASITFHPARLDQARLAHAVSISGLGLTSISLTTIMLLGLAFVASTVDRQASLQALALAKSRRELDVVFNSMNEAVTLVDSNGVVVRSNRAAVRLLGMPSGQSTLPDVSQLWDITTHDDHPIAMEDRPTAKALRGEFCENLELKMKRKDNGQTIFVEATTIPVGYAEGGTRQVMTTIRDITQRKRLDAASTLVAAIVESSQDAIIGKDLNGNVTSWNGGAEKTYGYTAEEMIGQSIEILMPPRLLAQIDSMLDLVKRGEMVQQTEAEQLRKGGAAIQVSMTCSPIRDDSGTIVGASMIVRDITDTKRLERQLRQSQKVEAIGQLAGGIAHDFNNLLGVVMGNLDLLARLIPGNEPALARLQTARRAARRGADLTRRLLTFASTDDLKPKSTKVDHAARNLLELASRLIGPEIQIQTEFTPGLPSVLVDPAGLEAALLNLVVNARDAMPQGGLLTVATKLSEQGQDDMPVQSGVLQPGRYVCIAVSDTGHGMTREVMEKAFEPFFTTKERGRGTGLGLPMVYGFAKQSGGTVRLYSEVGIGTTVTLFLPLAADEEVPAAIIPAPVPPSACEGTALVVDDEAELVEIAAIYLKEMGFTVITANDGNSALALVQERSDITLMLTDIIMAGGINGTELARQARAIHPAIHVVYSSGFPAGALAERTRTIVDGPLLRKPYERLEFQAIVATVMQAAIQASERTL